MREVKMPSGATLRINPAPFTDSKNLYMAVAAAKKQIQFNGENDIVNLQLDVICTLIASKEIEACLWACMKRCTYNDLKVDDSTFEPVAAREDYSNACMEVMHENIYPLAKHLYAWLKPFFPKVPSAQESK